MRIKRKAIIKKLLHLLWTVGSGVIAAFIYDRIK